MASNFKILINQNKEGLHLKLMGDFDGSSAHELLNTIRTYWTDTNKIFINTSGLGNIHPFGQAVFLNNFSTVNAPNTSFIFTGENVDKIAP